MCNKKGKEEKDLSNIVFSLSRGKFDGNTRKNITIPYICLVVLCGLLLTLAVTMTSIEYANGVYTLSEYIGSLVTWIFIFSVMPAAAYVYVHINKKIKKEILLWVEDAVEVNGYCRSLDVKYFLGIPSHKLQVDFYIGEAHYVRTTDKDARSILDNGGNKGYFGGASKFINKEVKILYSKKYDEVLILKL